MSIRKTFSNSTDMAVINECDKGVATRNSLVFGRVCHIASRSILWKGHFLGIYLTTFSESLTSKIRNLWRPNCLKFNLDFRNAAKNWEKNFFFWYNCMWIYIVKLSLLRTGYLSSAANVLTSSPKIFHVNKRHFFQVNWLGSDQWMW